MQNRQDGTGRIGTKVNGHVCIAERLRTAPVWLISLVPAGMAKIPIEPEGDLPVELVHNLALKIQGVPTPLLVTISTFQSCVVLGNVPMKSLAALDKSSIYMLLNSVLISELAEWEQENDA